MTGTTSTWQPPHGGWVRHDVTDVPPLGAYAARSCPVRTQWDELRPADPAPPSSFVQALGERGVTHEHEVTARLLALHGDDAVRIAEGDPEARVAATVAAMADGAGLIIGGRLPVDTDGRRVAEPDVLVRAGERPVDGRWRYRPVEVKGHGMLVDAGRGAPVVTADLDAVLATDPADAPATSVGDKQSGKAKPDLLQVAHYHRTLEACGHAPDGDVWGGVIGREGTLLWYRLDAPMWRTPATSGGRKQRTRTTLDVYDFEFGFRLDIRAVARHHRDDPDVDLLVEPVRTSECDSCRWRSHCGRLLAERQDVSLLPRTGWREWSALREVGATTIPALARLDEATDVDGLGTKPLVERIDQARARLGPDTAYRRRGVDEVDLRRADVEVDVDMENADEVYLWGAHVTDRVGADLVEPGYHPHVDWRPELAPDQAADLFAGFLDRLTGLRDACHARGLTFAAYCWSGPSAEERWMKRYADHLGRRDEVDAFLGSGEWVDLERLFTDRLVTGHGTSVKTVASLIGFAWSDDDPGGGQSMLWYAGAVDPSVSADDRQRLRDRVLAYNADDVQATLAVREWVDRERPFASVTAARPPA